MAIPAGRARYVARHVAPSRTTNLRITRLLVIPTALGLGVAAAVGSAAEARPAEVTAVALALGAPTTASSLAAAAATETPAGHPASAATNAAARAAAAAGEARAARTQEIEAASRTATRQALLEKSQGRAEARSRALAEERAAKKAAAARKAKAKAAAAAHRWVLPISHPLLTSPFGQRWGTLHPGIDFGTPVGTPVRAMSSGTVIFTGVAGGYGNKVEIRYWDGTISWYGHLDSISVKEGQQVTPGMVVAKSGNTGFSTGPHLHLELHLTKDGEPQDPAPWLTKLGLSYATAG